MQQTKRELWQAWRRGRESRAFEALVRPEISHALALARRMGADGADADDVVQESLVLLAKEQSDDPVRVGVRTWICRRVVLRAKMHVRASSRRRRHERSATRADNLPDPVAPLEIQDEVENAMRHLNDKERQAVLLRFLHDLDYRQMAYVLGASENACRIRVHKALGKLRGLLGGRAPALIAAIALPVATAQASTAVKGAVAAATTATAMATTTKVATVAVVAAAVTTAAVVLPREEEAPASPPPKELVAETLPEPPPSPPPARVEPPRPEPSPTPRAPTGLDLLAGHFEGGARAEALLWDFEKLERLMAPPGAEPVRIVKPGLVSLQEVAGETPSIVFGPGVFRIAPDRWKHKTVRGDLAALEIKGAGKGETTIICEHRDLLTVEGRVASVRLSGFTLKGSELLDVRGEAAALIQDVRVLGWPTGAGYGAPVGHSGRLLLGVSDCEFVGGYKRHAGGHALAPRGELLALFDRCRFTDLRPVFPLRIRGGTIRYGAPRFLEESRIERFGRGYLAGFEGATLQAGVQRCTLRDLWRVLSSYAPARAERIAGVRALVWDRAPLEYFAIHLASREADRTILVRQRGDRLEEVTEPGFVLPRFPTASEVYEGPDLVTVLRSVRTELDFSIGARGVHEAALNGRDGPVPAVFVVDALGARLLYVRVEDRRVYR
ncbi:MAG: RNA polymerase sigma factor [Planctomycetota bacterium]|jgi:RNA polymerase sigma-70 factor (ECF subfamily)